MMHKLFYLHLQGHSKLVELLRNHIVPSAAVSAADFLVFSFSDHILYPSNLLIIIPFGLKLEVYNAVSSPRIVTMANQVLTVNVTENVSVDL